MHKSLRVINNHIPTTTTITTNTTMLLILLTPHDGSPRRALIMGTLQHT